MQSEPSGRRAGPLLRRPGWLGSPPCTRDVDGENHVAVVLLDDPAAELHDWYGRYLYFSPDEAPVRSRNEGRRNDEEPRHIDTRAGGPGLRGGRVVGVRSIPTSGATCGCGACDEARDESWSPASATSSSATTASARGARAGCGRGRTPRRRPSSTTASAACTWPTTCSTGTTPWSWSTPCPTAAHPATLTSSRSITDDVGARVCDRTAWTPRGVRQPRTRSAAPLPRTFVVGCEAGLPPMTASAH